MWQADNWIKTLELDRTATVDDFTLDPHGNLWVVQTDNNITPSLARVGQYTLATGLWQWRTLPEITGSVQTILVDRHGRLWLQSRYTMEVFQLEASDSWRRLARYTAENSNYQAGYGNGGAQLGADGRLWVANETLAWIDTNASSLPQPLPEGLVQATAGPQARTFWLGWLILAALFFYGSSRWIYRHRQIKL
jgi:streptogramin lyase